VEDELEVLKRSSTAGIGALEGQLRADAAGFAAATAAHKILEHKLSAQATIFELKLAAA
jgi:hypothetical protein